MCTARWVAAGKRTNRFFSIIYNLLETDALVIQQVVSFYNLFKEN